MDNFTDAVYFDNTYSWARAKKLKYLVEIHTADNNMEQEVDQLTDVGRWTKLVKNMQITHL